MLKGLAVIIAGAAALSLTVGSAAGLGIGGSTVAAGNGAVSACGDTTGTAISYASDASGNLTAAAVTGLPSSCNGAQARVALTANSALVATTQSVIVAGGNATLPFSSSVPAATAVTVTSSRLVLTGP